MVTTSKTNAKINSKLLSAKEVAMFKKLFANWLTSDDKEEIAELHRTKVTTLREYISFRRFNSAIHQSLVDRAKANKRAHDEEVKTISDLIS